MFTIRKEELADCAGKLAPFLNEIADHALFLLDTSGCVLNWNAGAELLIGYTAQEIIGCHFSEFYTTEDVTAGIPRRALEMASREEKYQAEGLMVRKGGSRFWSTLTLTPLRDADGNLQGFVNLTRDDTERRTNAAALRASEEKYRILFDSMSEAFVLGEPILDAAGNAVDNRYLAVNNAFYTQTGTSGRSVEGRRMRECFPQIEQSDIYRYAAVARTGQPDRFETYNDDTRRHYDVHAFSPIPGRFALLFRDITGLKLEEELRTFKVFSDHSSEGNLIADKGGRIRYVNRRLCERLGYSEEEMLQLRLQDITTNSTEGLFWEIVERTKDGSMLPFESIRRRKDGSTFPVEVSATALEVKGEWLIFVVTRDITERKRTEDALRASEEKYRALFANMTEGFIVGEPVFDSAGNAVDHRYLVVNEAFYAQTGLDEDIEGRRMRECFPRVEQFEIDRYAAVVRTGQPYRFDNYDADTRRYYHAYAFRPGPGRFAILFRDITEQKQVEDELRMFKFFSDHSSENTLVVDSKGRIRYANRRLCERLGYSDEEILRLDLQDISPKFTTESSFWEVVERTRDGSMVPFESSRRCKDGSIFPVEVSATALEVKGEWVAFVVSRDITERKRAEQALQESEERFRLLYENAPIGIIQVDQNEHVTAANWKFAEISGYSPEEALRITHRDVTLLEESAGFAKRIEDLYSGRIDTLKLERRLVRKDKSVTWVWETVRLTRDKQGSVLWGIVILEDINARKQAEEALRQSEEKFRATFEHAPLGLAEATVHGRFINANAKLVEMLGYTKDEILRLTTRDVTHPSELERTLSNHQKLTKGEADSYVMEQRYVRKDRSLVWVNVTASMVSFHGKPQYMVLTIEDISARKKVEEDLRRTMEHSYHQANHDMLTGLANRASFTDRLNEALAYARRDDHLVAIHLLDLDQFKSINDTQGHHIGDILLQEVAKRIKSHVRATDLVARVGGDEFVVIQTQLMEPSAAGILAGKLVEELGGKYILENQELHSGASIGIAVFPGDTDNPEDLLKYADLALYEAKRRGRFNYQFYRQELGAAFLKTQRMDQDLVRALRENQFCLHYQPQFGLKNGRRMTGIEALLRWQHPERGTLAATEFLLDAERTGIILPIGEWALQTACRQHKAWVDAGLSVPLTLNLSAIQLRNPRLLETLQRILEETGLPASMLQLEMRERVLWNPRVSKNLLSQLKESGLRLALDDFGAEMTALPSLDQFPLDTVKPGQRLVKGLPSHPRETALLAAIVSVAHDLNIEVCADGVETDDQFSAVKEQGCDSAQGYWLSSPLDAHRMQQRIEAELTQ